jgi:hypothetical protein
MKVGEQNKAVISLKIPPLQPARMSSKTPLCTSRPAGREIDQTNAQGVEENKTLSRNPQLYRTRQR